jgi:hypothetical protein
VHIRAIQVAELNAFKADLAFDGFRHLALRRLRVDIGDREFRGLMISEPAPKAEDYVSNFGQLPIGV